MRRFSPILTIAGVALLILGADQWTKYQVHDRLSLQVGDSFPVINGFFDITLQRNPGAVAGLLGGNNPLLIGLSVAAIVLLIVFRRSFVTSHREHLFALGLIAGGILGNLADRIRLGFVVDFLYLHAGKVSLTYIFNIADAAICSGVAVYIIALLLPRKTAAAGQSPAPSANKEPQEQPAHGE
jgi:signal peptidase II